MRKVTLDAAPPMPWKNGGGVTRELAIAPAGAGLDDFDWRISCAQVASGGAFSPFPGVDRSLAVLDGAGLRLDFAGTHPLILDAGRTPLAFRGEQPVSAELLGGAVSDFNVMTRRTRWSHLLESLTLHGAHALDRRADGLFIYCSAGAGVGCELADGRRIALRPGEGLLFDGPGGWPGSLQAAVQVRVQLVWLWRR
jgi:environmental stress-induced protein Ves